MDISRYKDFIPDLSFLKNYTSLLVPVIIGLVAVLLFIPIQLMSGNLKERIKKESISGMGRQIQILNKSMVGRDQWKEEQAYQLAHERDANQIALLVLQNTQRQLLSYDVFP